MENLNRRNFLKGLSVGGLGIIATGCSKRLSDDEKKRLKGSNDIITGVVLHDKYVSPRFVGVDGKYIDGLVSQAYSNPTVRLGESIYNIKVRVDGGDEIVLNILDGVVPKESVQEMFSEGDRIGFTKGNLWVYTSGDGYKRVDADKVESGFYMEESQYVSRKPRHIRRLEVVE